MVSQHSVPVYPTQEGFYMQMLLLLLLVSFPTEMITALTWMHAIMSTLL